MIGIKIAELRRSKGINQKDLASEIGVSQPSLIKFEKGEVDIIPIGVAVKLVKTLGVSFNELFEIEDPGIERGEANTELEKLREEVRDLKKQIQRMDLTIETLNGKKSELEHEVAEQAMNAKIIDLLQSELYLSATDNEINEEVITLKNRQIYLLKSDFEYFVEQGVYEKLDLIDEFFNVKEFVGLFYNESSTKKEFIKKCAIYLNQFASFNESDIELCFNRYYISDKWNPSDKKSYKKRFRLFDQFDVLGKEKFKE